MSHPAGTPEARYAALVEALLIQPEVTFGAVEKKGFGSSELKVNNKIFAMLVRGRLVVKLSKARVDALVAAGQGECFDPRRDGRLMKEWISLEPTSAEEWLPLAREALSFVATKR
jgi:TfoX/Sxy family transcriptional regulator of competence genes